MRECFTGGHSDTLQPGVEATSPQRAVDHSWARRGTEHRAETIAWALSDEPRHVNWVEYREDGRDETTYRILTIGVNVEVLLTNSKTFTGLEPLYRHASK